MYLSGSLRPLTFHETFGTSTMVVSQHKRGLWIYVEDGTGIDLLVPSKLQIKKEGSARAKFGWDRDSVILGENFSGF